MDNSEWNDRLSEIERRLTRLEAAAVVPRKVTPPPLPPPLPFATVAPSPKSQPAPALLPKAPLTPSPLPARSINLEQAIGLKWTGWVGALVLVAGLAFGVKYAYDQGWFGHLIPPWVWLTLIFAAGIALIGAGEWVYRRVNVLSAASLFGAGVAVLFLASYVGYFQFDLYPQSTAFVLMGLSALIGSAVAMHGNLVSIAILSLLGANLAPVLLSNDHPQLFPFLIYLLALQVVALILADWGRGAKWWTLRGLSLATTAIWMAVNFDAYWSRQFNLKLTFILLFAALYHGEVLFFTFRKNAAFGHAFGAVANVAERTDGPRSSPTAPASRTSLPGPILILLTTALMITALLNFEDTHSITKVSWILGVAAVCALLGIICNRFASEASPLNSLAVSYAIQCAGLLVLAVPNYFDMLGTVIGWGILSVAFAALGRLGRLQTARYAAVATWVLAVCALLLEFPKEFEEVLFTIISEPIRQNLLLAWLLVVAANVIAPLSLWRSVVGGVADSGNRDDWRDGSTALHIAAAGLWCSASVLGLPPLWATLAMLAYAWRFFLPDAAALRDRLSVMGAALVVLTLLKWAAVDTLAPHHGFYRPLLNLQLAVGLLLIFSLAAMRPLVARLEQKLPQKSPIAGLSHLLGALIPLAALWAGSFEIIRYCQSPLGENRFTDPDLALQVGLSLFWALFAIASVITGFALRLPLLRYFALGLFALTLLKIVVVDMSSVQTGYRILSFLAMGLLLLGTSVLYGRFRPSHPEPRSPQ